MDGDEDTLKQFSFVLDDYLTTHWYWEVVELSVSGNAYLCCLLCVVI